MALYRFFLRPLVFLTLPFLKLFNEKIRTGLEDRKLNKLPKRTESSSANEILWIHCASGEFEYARSVLKALKEGPTNAQTLVTYFSPTYKKWILSSKDVDFSSPLPFDSPRAVIQFLEAYSPKALAIARTDIWPELLTQCRQRNIPTLLFSPSLSAKLSWWQRPILRFRFSLVDHIFLVSPSDLKMIPPLLKPRAKVVGDTRYDQCLDRKSKGPKYERPHQKKSLMLASLWPGDIKTIRPILTSLAQTYHIIWVPHEPHPQDLERLKEDFPKLKSLPFSKTLGGTHFEDHDILLVDQVGHLADLYQWAHLSFIGGSFNREVHSVMESLVWGAPALVGPNHNKNSEARQFKSFLSAKSGLAAVSSVSSAEEFTTEALKYASQWQNEDKQSLIQEFDKHRGASKEVAQWMENQRTQK